MLDTLGKYGDWGPVLLRFWLGVAFIVAGVSKFLDLSGTGQMFAGWFGGLGMSLAVLVAAVELLGGLGLLLGVWTRVAALFLSIVMLVAIITVWHVEPMGLFGTLSQIFVMNMKSNMIVSFAYLVMLLALALRGAQKWALLPDD